MGRKPGHWKCAVCGRWPNYKAGGVVHFRNGQAYIGKYAVKLHDDVATETKKSYFCRRCWHKEDNVGTQIISSTFATGFV